MRGHTWLSPDVMDTFPDSVDYVTVVRLLPGVIIVLLSVWGLFLLRIARIQAGDLRGWRAFREWGVPLTLLLAAALLISVPDGGGIDRLLARSHWHLLEGVWEALYGVSTVPGGGT